MNFAIEDESQPLQNQHKIFLQEMGINFSIVHLKQTHSTKVITIDDSNANQIDVIDEADAFITQRSNVALAIRTADCLSAFIYDMGLSKSIGLVHAGWKGSHKEIVVKTVEAMQEQFGTHPSDLKVAFGPSMQPCCYIVEEEFLEYFPNDVVRRDGKYHLNLPQANRNQLLRLGVKEQNIFDCGVCTCCTEKYFSYRRQGDESGRMILLMMKGK